MQVDFGSTNIDRANRLDARSFDTQVGEVEQVGVGELGRGDVLDGSEDRLDATRMFALPLAQHLLDRLPLQVLLRAAQVAGDDRELAGDGEGFEVGLLAIGERTDDDVGTGSPQRGQMSRADPRSAGTSELQYGHVRLESMMRCTLLQVTGVAMVF